MLESKSSFEDSEAQSFISSNDNDVTLGWESAKYRLQKSHSRTIKVYRIVLGCFVLLYIISGAILAWRARLPAAPLLLQQELMGLSKSVQYSNAIGLNEYKVPKAITTFHNDVNYVEGKFDGPWGDYMVPGGGEVVVPEPARWNLTGGFPAPPAARAQYGPETEFYMISVFHQMHCLLSIKENYDMTNHVLDNQDLTLESEKSQTSRKNDPTHAHLNHCFTYLRQGLLCSADTTLEPATVRDGVRVGEYTGWEFGRECKDWGVIADFAREHQYDPWATENA